MADESGDRARRLRRDRRRGRQGAGGAPGHAGPGRRPAERGRRAGHAAGRGLRLRTRRAGHGPGGGRRVGHRPGLRAAARGDHPGAARPAGEPRARGRPSRAHLRRVPLHLGVYARGRVPGAAGVPGHGGHGRRRRARDRGGPCGDGGRARRHAPVPHRRPDRVRARIPAPGLHRPLPARPRRRALAAVRRAARTEPDGSSGGADAGECEGGDGGRASATGRCRRRGIGAGERGARARPRVAGGGEAAAGGRTGADRARRGAARARVRRAGADAAPAGRGVHPLCPALPGRIRRRGGARGGAADRGDPGDRARRRAAHPGPDCATRRGSARSSSAP